MSSLKHRRRRLRVEIGAYENRLAALYTEVDRIDAALENGMPLVGEAIVKDFHSKIESAHEAADSTRPV